MKIALALGVDVQDIIPNWDTMGIFKGFSKKLLEVQALKFLQAKNCKEFNVVLALLVHGIMPLPNIDNFVDHLDAEIFLSGNVVPFILANIYHALHTHHENKHGSLICCAPLLHAWLLNHMPKEGPFVSKDLKWPQRLASLTYSTIKWYRK